jgi:GMP synthase (glutamine-hydrolysing)
MPHPILIILHQEHSTPGRIGHALEQLGYPLDVRRPRFGEALPPTMAEHAGAVIFGGPMSANDSDDFIRREIDWIGVPLRENKPFLGICLGAQRCAKHLGGRVFRHPNGHVEVGYYPVRPTADGLAVVPTWPEYVYQWHREGFDLPTGAELLAESDIFEVQAIRCGRMSAWSCRARGRATPISPTARSTTFRRGRGSAFFWSGGSAARARDGFSRNRHGSARRRHCPAVSCCAK